jgi:histidyl-tRNA synthetase
MMMSMSTSPPPQAPKGTVDFLPPDGDRLQALEDGFTGLARRYGYRRVYTPTIEHTEVFLRLGEATDVVRKEMYTFEDRGGRSLTLRPEATAGIVRSFVEHGLAKRVPLPWKVYSVGQNFRAEAPQKGRYREFRQLDAEAIGDAGPAIDVEVIDLAMEFLRVAEGGELALLVNSMGDGACKPAFVDLFRSYLEGRRTDLCRDCGERIEGNPLRVLDCKNPGCRAVTEDAPRIVDHLCDPCGKHLDAVLTGLDALGWKYRVEPRLVRGLDYYTRTTFEIQSADLDAAQNALGGGGRYDGLVEDLGGDPTPGIGFALGCERILLATAGAVTAAGTGPGQTVQAVVVDVAGGTAALEALSALRKAGVSADGAGWERSMKAQMRSAERLGAVMVVVLGPDEVAQGTAQIKDLRSGEQRAVALSAVADEVKGALR